MEIMWYNVACNVLAMKTIRYRFKTHSFLRFTVLVIVVCILGSGGFLEALLYIDAH